ncbi:DEAD/DEAH box helicase [Ferrimonas balearica]|uniref:DEAD/DEAH box helicase n=1 Tax=Ferrimonas balearica TaxID=44012 RepID=UPI001C98502F|nr:DEAD/DEAH box helicase [Ferrimonas balearica]MBY6224312.1 DEAD/DEAH box helicase [Ferrimonas balearica]
MSFASQGFCPEIVQALEQCGYQKMTPIQQKAIPLARKGHDILANAQTGTGKTAAFALPMLQSMVDKPQQRSRRHVRGLILAPTRELAQQVADNVAQYHQFLPFTSAVAYGGVKMASQARQLEAGVDILVATPGRLQELMEMNMVSLAQVEYLVLDEADRMLDMGFIGDIQRIREQIKLPHQTMLFSATYPPKMKQLAAELLKKPKMVSVGEENRTAETVAHVFYPVDEDRKIELLSELIGRKNWQQVLVFVNYKEHADAIAEELNNDGLTTGVCHGDRSQGNRRRALKEFKEGKLRVLVATDVAARGLDIQGLPHVVNYDLPFLAEDYVHRIGRTGRAGLQGHAVSLVGREDELTAVQIERLIGQRIRRVEQPGYEARNRDALVDKFNSKAAFRDRKGRTNRASDQSGAERQLRLRQAVKARLKQR